MPKFFRRRLNDYEKIEKLNKKNFHSLVKNEDYFIPTQKARRYGGILSEGPHVKRSNKGEKIYYISPHNEIEYFGLEILNRIGFNTPKSRMLPYFDTLKIASKSIEGYIPIAAFIHDRTDKKDVDFSDDPALREIHNKYKLDMNNQIIIDIKTGAKHKISGNLFVSNIGANILNDGDFQPEDFNVGFKKIGSRFYAFLIDKEKILFSGKTYEDSITDTDVRVSKSNLYTTATDDQKLYILSETRNALEADDFRKIFFNSRTEITKGLVKRDLQKWSENFHNTAKSTISYFTEDAKDKDLLDRFIEREKLRDRIAGIVIDQLAIIANNIEKEDLKRIIMEDLRAPYYAHFFMNKENISEQDLENDNLINAVLIDQINELKALNIVSMRDVFLSLKDFANSEENRLSKRKSTDKLLRLKDLNIAIKVSEPNFLKMTPEEQKIIIISIVKHMDIISHYSENISFITATSEANWIAFKEKHKVELQSINPGSINIENGSAKIMEFGQYQRQLGIFGDPVRNIEIDLTTTAILPKLK